MLPIGPRFHLREALEHPVAQLNGDADTRVRNRKLNLFPVWD
jgi:hypothetical protein